MSFRRILIGRLLHSCSPAAATLISPICDCVNCVCGMEHMWTYDDLRCRCPTSVTIWQSSDSYGGARQCVYLNCSDRDCNCQNYSTQQSAYEIFYSLDSYELFLDHWAISAPKKYYFEDFCNTGIPRLGCCQSWDLGLAKIVGIWDPGSAVTSAVLTG